jgi:hypothetical protein
MYVVKLRVTRVYVFGQHEDYQMCTTLRGQGGRTGSEGRWPQYPACNGLVQDEDELNIVKRSGKPPSLTTLASTWRSGPEVASSSELVSVVVVVVAGVVLETSGGGGWREIFGVIWVPGRVSWYEPMFSLY